MNSKSKALLLLVIGILIGAMPHQSVAQAAADAASQIAALRAELDTIKTKLPDQSHAMKDVGYHFTNLWFAGEKKNWPLAKFYLDETRSHLKWAVSIIPVRKTKAGDFDLRAFLEGVDKGMLSQVQTAIQSEDPAKFVDAYKLTLEGCYACHKAAEKPYLRPQIPVEPEVRIINFDPTAKWPE